MALRFGVMRWLLAASAAVAGAMQPTAHIRLLVGELDHAARRVAAPRATRDDLGIASSFLETAENFKRDGGDLAALPQTFAVVHKAVKSQLQSVQERQDEADAKVSGGMSMASESVELKGEGAGDGFSSSSFFFSSDQGNMMATLLRMVVMIAVFVVVFATIVHFRNSQGGKRSLYDSCDGSDGASLAMQPMNSLEMLDKDGNVIHVPRTPGNEDSAPERADMPNFSGNWRLQRIEGNMDAFMTEMGVGWFARMVNKSMRYGVEKQTQHIVQVGNAFQITTVDLWSRRLSQKFLVDGGEQLSSDAEDNTIIIDPRWEGQSLTVGHRTNLGEAIQIQKRMLVDEAADCKAMRLDIVAPHGSTVRRIFQRL